MKRRPGVLIQEKSWGIFHRIPIWIYDIVKTDIFPVKFEYRQRGYKGLQFSEQLNKVEFL